MYKAAVRFLLRKTYAKLSSGDADFVMRLAHPDAMLAFPGHNSWATMFRPQHKGREMHATHRGLDECRAFAERFVNEGIVVDVDDILVNGGPWRTRIAVRAVDHIAGPDGNDVYNNRYVGFLEIRWGRLTSWEVYEDTERTAAWDAATAGATA